MKVKTNLKSGAQAPPCCGKSHPRRGSNTPNI